MPRHFPEEMAEAKSIMTFNIDQLHTLHISKMNANISIRKTVNNISSTFYFPWYTMYCIWDNWKSMRIVHISVYCPYIHNGKGGAERYLMNLFQRNQIWKKYFKEICFDGFPYNQYHLEEFTETKVLWNKYFFWRIETFDIVSFDIMNYSPYCYFFR